MKPRALTTAVNTFRNALLSCCRSVRSKRAVALSFQSCCSKQSLSSPSAFIFGLHSIGTANEASYVDAAKRAVGADLPSFLAPGTIPLVPYISLRCFGSIRYTEDYTEAVFIC